MTSENLATLAGAFVGSCAGMIVGWYARDAMRSLRAIRRALRQMLAGRQAKEGHAR